MDKLNDALLKVYFDFPSCPSPSAFRCIRARPSSLLCVANRSLTWSAQAITWRWRTTKSYSCTPPPCWTTNPSGCSTTSSCSPLRTTSARARTSSRSGESEPQNVSRNSGFLLETCDWNNKKEENKSNYFKDLIKMSRPGSPVCELVNPPSATSYNYVSNLSCLHR